LALSIPTAGADVIVDGEVIATTPLTGPLAVPTGRHQLMVRASGFRSFGEEVVISSGVAVDLSVDLERETPFFLRRLPAIGGANLVGAAGCLAAGLAFYVASTDTHASYLEANDLVRMRELREESERQLLYANGFLAGGGVLATAGITLILIEALGGSADDKPVRIDAAPMPAGGSVRLTFPW
jgi:hypothetical protein